ncbi:MAG: amidohydrolase [Vicinamibacterales bacterium]
MRRCFFSLMFAMAALMPSSLLAQQAPADIILTNGKIITVDDQFRIAQAVAIRGDRVVGVGTNAEITRLAGANTRRIDLRGKSVVPGLIDNHAHYQEEGAYWTLELRFDGVSTRKQALEMIRTRAQSVPNGGWVFNLGGWSPDQFSDDKREFTREELDKVAPNNPVFLQFTRYAQYLNSKAIEQLGLDAMKEPWIERDASGRPTGITRVAGRNALFTKAAFLDVENGGKANLPMDVIVASQKVMLRDLNKSGLTASAGQCMWDELYRDLAKKGEAQMRFFCQQTAQGGRGVTQEQMIAQLPKLRYHDGDEWMTNANYGERFPGGGGGDVIAPGPEPVASQEVWDAWGRFGLAAAKAGIPVQLHSVTTLAIGAQIDQVEKIAKEVNIRPLRWSFMHMEGVTPEQVDRMKALNMFIAINPRPVVSGGLLLKIQGDKGYQMPNLRYIQDSGIKWGFGTDAFEVNQFRPFQVMYFAVTGKMVGGMVVNKATITREEALIAYSRNNAYLLFRENDLGSIAPGYFADMVVLDRDYLTVPAEQIKDVTSVMTIVGGRVVYDAAAPATN